MKTQIQAPSGSFQNRPKSFLRKRVTISNTWVPQDIHGSEEGHLLPLWNLRHGWIWDGLLFVVPSKNMTQLDPVATKLEELRTSYLTYCGHVMHGVYEGHSEKEAAEKIAEAEASWPEHKNARMMIACPAYQRRRAVHAECADEAEARSWAMEYLKDDVANL